MTDDVELLNKLVEASRCFVFGRYAARTTGRRPDGSLNWRVTRAGRCIGDGLEREDAIVMAMTMYEKAVAER